jgi:predicted nucleotidyltransferase
MGYRLQPQLQNNRLSQEYSIAVLYHDIFGYPLKENELVRWKAGERLKLRSARPRVYKADQYLVFKGREIMVSGRLEKEASSKKKARALPKIKAVLEEQKDILMVGITGSLAMNAAADSSDIDLLIITKTGKLWTTRLKTLLALKKQKVPTRRARDKNEQNKACLNIWMDERDLKINVKNAYTAHELAQIVPLINKNKTYEKLLAVNSWILGYWPNAVEITSHHFTESNRPILNLLEILFYQLQRLYMSSKITSEEVSRTRAFFHPNDWSKRVVKELDNKGVVHV